MRYEAGIVGGGGQGVVLMGTILAETAAASENLFMAQTQSYDPAVRGGRAESNLVISDEEIDYPGVLDFDLLLALSQEGYDKSAGKLGDEALVVTDPDLVNQVIWHKILKIPFTAIARKKFKDERAANMVALGALSRLCEYFPSSAVKSSISSRFKGKTLDLNLSSFQEGIDQADKIQALGFEKVEEEDIEI